MRILVRVALLLLLLVRPALADTTLTLDSAQEGDPGNPRAIILLHDTFSTSAEWQPFLLWWQTQWPLRQMYSIYSVDYDSVATRASDSGSQAFSRFASEPGNWNVVATPDAGTYFRLLNTWSRLNGIQQRVDKRMDNLNDLGSTLQLVPAAERETVCIGHGQGGLVAKEMALMPRDGTQKPEVIDPSQNQFAISKILYVGTAHDGIPMGLQMVVYKTSVGLAGAIGVTGALAQGLQTTVQALTPGLRYMDDLRDPALCSRYHPGWVSWSQVNGVLAQKGIKEYCLFGVWSYLKAWKPALANLFHMLAGLGAGDGLVSVGSALGQKNGPLAGDHLAGKFRFDLGNSGDQDVLHTYLPRDLAVSNQMGTFLADQNTREADIIAQRQMIEQQYYNVLGRFPYPVNDHGDEAKYDDPGFANWAAQYARGLPGPLDQTVSRVSDDQGLYTFMWVLKDSQGLPLDAPHVQQFLLGSPERASRIQALYLAMRGTFPDPITFALLSSSPESMAAIRARIGGFF